MSDKRVAKVNLLKEQLVESEKKLTAKEEELKANRIDLVAKSEELEKAWTEMGNLGESLLGSIRRLGRPQLEQAKIAIANAISEYQASEEMAALRKSLLDEGFEENAQAFRNTMASTHLDWDLAFLGEHLINQIAAWRDEW